MNTHAEILLVEDSPYDAEFTIRALKKRSPTTHLVHVEDGQSALDFMFGEGRFAGRDIQNQPAVVLLDLKMPKLDGLDVLRALRADERTKKVPIVMLTSSHEDCDLTEAYQLGVNSYIVKPFDSEKYLEVVEGLFTYWLLLNQLPPIIP